MKTKFIILPVLVLALSGCDVISKIVDKNYAGYEEYLTEGQDYTKSDSINGVNIEAHKHIYNWSHYVSEAYSTDTYYTGHKYMVSAYADKLYVYTLNGKQIVFNPSHVGSFNYVIQYTDHELFSSNTQYVGEDNSKFNNSGLPIDLQKYDDGYLVVFGEDKEAIYFTNDFKFYVNENNSKTFVGFEDTKVVGDSELLNSCLKEEATPKLALPDMEGITDYFSGPNYYKEKYSNYGIYLGGIEPEEYVSALENAGFNVERDDEDLPFLPFYRQRGGSWIITDPNHEFRIHMKFQDYLYINNLGKSFGPTKNIYLSIYASHDNYFDGHVLTNHEDWTADEKATMASWYDGTLKGTIPFIKMNNGYMVPTIKSYASDDLFGGALKLHSECYNISDGSQTYCLQEYGEILEAAGYHKYISPEPWTDEFDAWEDTEDCKYYNCYINQEADIAVKFGFNASRGNLIRVFKLSEMQSWHQNEVD